MTFAAQPPGENVLLRLRQFARKRAAMEHCELCGLELTPDHEHLVEPTSHKLLCACMACSILFDAQHNAKYKRVPHTVRLLENFQLNAAQWESLRIPIELAFFFHSSPHARVIALYPSPAGAIESLLSLDTWDDLVQANPVLQKMEADVVALLVNRVGSVQGSQPAQYFLVPIDECYKLVGLIRANWRGLSGGTEVWREVASFFHQLRQKSISRVEAAHA